MTRLSPTIGLSTAKSLIDYDEIFDLHPELLVAAVGGDPPGVEGEEVESGDLAHERRAAAVPRSVQVRERVHELDAA